MRGNRSSTTSGNYIIRPHHPLVMKMDSLWLGQRQKPVEIPQIRIWQTVNEWLVIASLCLLISLMTDVILRF